MTVISRYDPPAKNLNVQNKQSSGIITSPLKSAYFSSTADHHVLVAQASQKTSLSSGVSVQEFHGHHALNNTDFIQAFVQRVHPVEGLELSPTKQQAMLAESARQA